MIPFNDLSRQYISIHKEIDEAINRVINKGIFILGDEVKMFEEEFARYLGVSHATGVGSGTDALNLAMRALDIGPHDEVILPANSYPTAFGISLSGAKIKLVDVLSDGNLDPEKLPDVITKNTKAVVTVHLYGNPADVFSIQNILSKYHRKIYLIEDCAQAHGTYISSKSSYQTGRFQTQLPDRKVSNPAARQESSKLQKKLDDIINFQRAGSAGDIGCFSFYPTKNLGAYGDGGMLVTNNKDIKDRLIRLRMYGEVSRYESIEISGISRLDELQAAILRVKLCYLDKWNSRRQEIARIYTKELANIGDIKIVGNNDLDTKDQSVHHLFVIRTKKRDDLKTYLATKGIYTAIHYPKPIHLQESFKYLKYIIGDFPISEKQSQEILSIPIYPELTNQEIRHIISAIQSYF